jgi:hypothetical protein
MDRPLSHSFHELPAQSARDNRTDAACIEEQHMKILRSAAAVGICVSVCAAAWIAHAGAETANTTAADRAAITGAWTFDADLSDKPPARPEDSGDRPSGRGRRGMGGGGMGRGMGGGMRRGGGAGGGARTDPEEMARVRDAVHDIMTPAQHLTITQTDSMVLVTSEDGRTTRLSPDGSRIKDDSTESERKTRWDGGKLVSEITGLGSGKITESYEVDAEHHQLHVTVQTEGGRRRKPMTLNRIYDADPR